MADRKDKLLFLVRITLITALCVIVLGAYVRLTDAGLGCPDWPGCYGQLIDVPRNITDIEKAESSFPGWSVDSGKAWREMTHRYLAAGLGMLVLMIVIFGRRFIPPKTLFFLSILIVFQALLGMWTVTLLLQPLIVMMHLLGGFAVLSMLWWIYLNLSQSQPLQLIRYKPWLLMGTLLIVVQIALGGWTSANYAALACFDFPLCNGQWLPQTDYKKAFFLEWASNKNYEYGTLDMISRITIHFTHRLGALIVTFYWLILLLMMALHIGLQKSTALMIMLGILSVQVGLGISNVLFALPLPVAVGHNAIAAILLLCSLYLLRNSLCYHKIQ